MLDLGDGDPCGGRHHRVEIASRLAIDKIAFAVGLPGVNDCKVGDEPALHDVSLSIEIARLLAFGYQGPHAGLGEERRNPGTTRPNPLVPGSLRREFELEVSL